jgi:hypothetical protein
VIVSYQQIGKRLTAEIERHHDKYRSSDERGDGKALHSSQYYIKAEEVKDCPHLDMITKDSSPGQSHFLETTSTAETAVPHDPPEYISQSQFHVGRAITPVPFVTPSQLKIHLGLLRAFRELKLKVQENPDVANAFPPLAAALDPEARWVWFLELALERYAIHHNSLFHKELVMTPPGFRDGFGPLARCRRLWIIRP